jgi:hypothetical protein
LCGSCQGAFSGPARPFKLAIIARNHVRRREAPVADSRFAQFASSDPTGPDPAGPDAAFWDQRVYFDGVPRRRREIVPTLAATPYMTERAARLLLATAQVAGAEPAVKPPAAWFHSYPTVYTTSTASSPRRGRGRRRLRRGRRPTGGSNGSAIGISG